MIYPSNELTKENVYAEIMRCDIKFSDIVLSQTLLETGHYKSHNCLQRNNLLGLKGGEKTPDNLHGYRIFNHWRESIQCYKDWQETRLTDSCTDYFQFLVDWKYAESPEYCDKLRSIVSVFKIIIKK
jgi:flagellum-specific peptidoglycan hydrolase FlgJ